MIDNYFVLFLRQVRVHLYALVPEHPPAPIVFYSQKKPALTVKHRSLPDWFFFRPIKAF